MEDGREVDYSVTTLVRDAVILEDILDELDDDQISHVEKQVVSAMEKLHSLDLANNSKAQEMLRSGVLTIPDDPVLSHSVDRIWDSSPTQRTPFVIW